MAKKNLAEKVDKTDKSASSANVEKVSAEKSSESAEEVDPGEPGMFVHDLTIIRLLRAISVIFLLTFCKHFM